MEEWKDIEGYEGIYQISSMGRVKIFNFNSKKKNSNNHIIRDNSTLTKNTRGYYCIKTVRKGKRIELFVHRAVAQSFPDICGEWFEGCVVHHKDNDKSNNQSTNLIVLTKKEHQDIHANDGLTYKKVSEKLKGKKKNKEHIEKIIKNRKQYKGENNPMYGKYHSKETKEKIRLKQLGKKHSDETKKKMSMSRGKGVIAYKDGIPISQFRTIKEGADHFGLHPQNINANLKGRIRHCGGYEWRYAS